MILLALVILLLAMGSPLFVVIGVAGSFAFFVYGGLTTIHDQEIIVVQITEIASKNVFLAVPFFVFSGAIMSAGDIARRLVDFAEALVGWMRGGLAVAAVLACVCFAAISGSSVVTLIAIGGIMFPALTRAGYKEPFTIGLLATAGSLGCLVPPSLPMLIYSISVSGQSAVDVRELFLAGLGPAFLIAGMLSLYAVLRAGPVAQSQRFSFGRLKQTFVRGIWALALPGLILGGIYGRVFTATEASAVSVVYAVVVETLIHRSLSFKQLPAVVLKSVSNLGALMLIVLLSFSINYFMVEQRVADSALAMVRDLGLGAGGFMMAINVFLVVTGMFMDSISAIVLFTPIIAPAATSLGIDPLHLGVVFIVNMEIGYLAPPIATNLFVAATIFKRPFGMVTKAVLPTLGILCVGLVLVTYIPTLSTGPVYALKGEGFYQPFTKLDPTPTPTPAPGIDATPTETPGKTLTIQEMMEAARKRREEEAARAAAGESPVASPTPEASPSATPAKTMTIQEMMEAAKKRREEEAAASPSPTSSP